MVFLLSYSLFTSVFGCIRNLDYWLVMNHYSFIATERSSAIETKKGKSHCILKHSY